MPPAIPDNSASLTVTQAAALAGMHPQTVRQYDRIGLVRASRTVGRSRRYSMPDVHKLREVQRLGQDEGINLAGIKRILELEARVARLERELARASSDYASSGWAPVAESRLPRMALIPYRAA